MFSTQNAVNNHEYRSVPITALAESASRDDVLMDVAKRYRVNIEKLQKAVAAELVAKRDKKTKAKAKPKARKTAA